MTRRFTAWTPEEFVAQVRAYPWSDEGKTQVHVHHTWRPNHSQYRGESTILGMWRYHTQTNGWSDIAQHVSIAPDGTIWSGRNWNATPTSARGHNSRQVFMFETIGDFDVGKDRLEGEQLRAVLITTAAIQEQFGLPLWASVKFHNQMSGKTCPGSGIDRVDFIRKLKPVRDEVAAMLHAPGEEMLDVTLHESMGMTEEAVHDQGLAQYWQERDAVSAAVEAALPQDNVLLETTAVEAPAWSEQVADGAALARAAQRSVEGADDEERALLFALGEATSPNLVSSEDVLNEGFVDDVLLRAGRKVLRRLEREVHAIICGTGEDDSADRNAIRELLKLSDEAAAGAITALLISGLGVAPLTAGIVGALIWRRFVQPAIEAGTEEVCTIWSEHIAALD